MKSKSKLIYIISAILIATLMISSILLIGFSFGWFGDKKGADVTIKVSQIKSTVTSETQLEPSALVAGNFFDKTLNVKIESEAEIYLRTYAEMVVQTNDGDKTNLIELIKVTKTRKGRDNKFYYVADSNSVATINGNADLSLTYKFFVDSGLSSDLFKDADGNYDNTKKIKITYYFEYCQKEGYDEWGSELVDETSEKYTITFDANGGTLAGNSTLQLEFGDTITGLPTATKDNYVFTGWQTIGGSTVKENSKYTWKNDITLYAQFRQAKYTITFVNYDGSELQSSQVEFNTMPTAPTTTPTRPSTSKYDYEFSGWSPILSLVSGDKTYTATYTEKLRTYTITFVNYDGSELLTLTDVPYGTIPEYNKETPTKPTDDNFIYTFSGWSPTISSVSGNATYTAQYTKRVAKAYLNEVEFKNLTSLKTISFEKTAPTGYVKSDSLTSSYGSNGIEVYYNGGSETAPQNISLVFEGTIIATSNKYFQNCENLTTLTFNNFDTSEMTDMSSMFKSCWELTNLNLSNFDTKNVTNMSNMFNSCYAITSLDLSNFDTKNVTSMASMFGSYKGTSITFGDNFVTTNVKNMEDMFSGCSALTSLDLSKFNTNSVENMSGMFDSCSGLTSLDLSNFDTSNVTNMSSMFNGCSSLTTLDVSNFDTSKVTIMSTMFMECFSLIDLDLSSFDTSNVTDMSFMFVLCSALKNVNLTKFNTRKVTSIRVMFSECSSLETVDLSAFVLKTPSTGTFNATGMFDECTSLNTIVAPQEIDEGIEIELPTTSNWYIEGLTTTITKITNLEQGKTIRNYIVTMDLPSDWQTKISNIDATQITKIGFENFASSDYKQVENSFNNAVKTYVKNGTEIIFVCDSTIYSPINASNLFSGLSSLTEISFGNFKLKDGCTNLSELFKNDTSLMQINLTDLNTNDVTNISGLFSGCTSLNKISLGSNFINANIVDMSSMFENCSELEEIDLSKFVTTNVKKFDRMFYGCNKLTTLDLSSFVINQSNVPLEYTEVEYLESTGTQYIDTGYYHNQSTKVVGDFEFTSVPTTNQYIFGTIDTSTSCFGFYRSSGGKWSYQFGDGANQNIWTDVNVDANRHTVTLDAVNRKLILTSGSSTILDITSDYTITKTSTKPLYLFMRSYTSNNEYAKAKIYGFKIYENDTLVRNFIPCKRNSDGTLGLFDMVTKTFYTNAGTGEFNTGDIVLPSEYTKKEYIQASGEQYIKTDYTPTSNTKIDLDVMFTDRKTTEALFCARAGLSDKTYSLFAFGSQVGSTIYRTDWNNSQINTTISPAVDVKYNIQFSKGIFAINNTINKITDTSDFTAGGELMIFGSYTSGNYTTVSNYGKFKLYGFKIYENNTLVRNFVPCVRKSDQVAGMFDIVQQKFYTNSGSGTFNTGAVVTNSSSNVPDMLTGCDSLVQIETPSIVGSSITLPTAKTYYLSSTGENVTEITSSMNNQTIFDHVVRAELSANWKTEVPNSSDITAITFTSKIPSGYSTTPVYSWPTGIKAYRNGTQLAFVYRGLILAPKDSTGLFQNLSNLTNITLDNFRTSITTNMQSMFNGCTALKSVDVSKFDTTSVTDMSYMFFGCNNLSGLNLLNFNTQNVTNLYYMFGVCFALTKLDLSSFNTSNVTTMECLFDNCINLESLDISSFDTSNVTNFHGMFWRCYKLTTLDLSHFNTSNITNMEAMFTHCRTLTTLNVSSFDTSKVTRVGSMFSDCPKLKNLDLSNFNISNECNGNMLANNSEGQTLPDEIKSPTTAIEITLPANYYKDGYYANSISSITSDITAGTTIYSAPQTAVFPTDWKDQVAAKDSTLTETEITGIKFEKTAPSGYTKVGTTGCFSGFGSSIDLYKNGTNIAFVSARTIEPVNCNSLFVGLMAVTSISFNNFDTQYITDMSSMFFDWEFAESISIDISGLNTKNVENMNSMFSSCFGLNELKLGDNFDTSNVKDMGWMFSGCRSLSSLDLSKFNTSKVTNMTYMFEGCESLTSLDLSKFDTTNVTNMNGMFMGCSSLANIDLSSFNTSKVTDMSYMFSSCSQISSINFGSNFDTSNVTNMSNMFENAGISMDILDLSKFEIKAGCDVTDMLTGLTNGSGSSIYYIVTPSTAVEITLPTNYYIDGYGAPYTKIPTNMNAGTLLGTNCGEVTLPSDWKTTLGSMATSATKIYFSSIIPSGLTYKAKLDTTDATGSYMDIYGNGTEIAFVNGNTIYAPDDGCKNLFEGLSTLKEIYLKNFNTTEVKSFNSMFSGCTALQVVDLSGMEFNISVGSGVNSATILQNLKNLHTIYAPTITKSDFMLLLPSISGYSFYVDGESSGTLAVTSSMSAGTKIVKKAK